MSRGNEDRGAEEWRKEIRFGMLHETSGRHGEFRNNETDRKPDNVKIGNSPSGNSSQRPVIFMLHETSGRNGEFPDSSRNVGNRCIPVNIPAPDPVLIHADVTCDQCGSFPIQGIRYRCSMCPNYDLCENCLLVHENNQKKLFSFHDVTHLFIRVASPRKDFLTYPIIMNRTTTKHTGVACSICSTQDPEGYLYKCQHCSSVNINICESCEAKGLHDPGHPRLKLSLPSAESELAQSRVEIAKLQAQLSALKEKERENTNVSNAGSSQRQTKS